MIWVMITPSPTTPIDPTLARGTLAAYAEPTATRDGYLVLAVPNTSYELHLRGPRPASAPGSRLVGTVRVQSRRIDEVEAGGRYIEPVMGRPRRVQGRVIAVTTEAVVVDAGIPIHCVPTDDRQKPGDFSPGQFVSCDVLDGATFFGAGGARNAG
jgi:hypothetical protein